MCGIAGKVGEAEARKEVAAALTLMARRGPDGEGIEEIPFSGGSITFGHRRLSIIDLAGGAQPMLSAGGKTLITFNGEILNYRELRREAEAFGYQFRTRSDTEVILAFYEKMGLAALGRLQGMFALAIWDTSREELVLARDHAGIKPLCYFFPEAGSIAFASDLNGIEPFFRKRPELDLQAVRDLFHLDYALPPRTFYKGVKKLEPGCAMVWSKGESRREIFWRLPQPVATSGSVLPALREQLRAAVTANLVADVPVGVLLSGGLDSSLVGAIASRASSDRLHTFSIGFTEPGWDESPFAREMAASIGSEHHELILSPEELYASIDDSLSVLDEPLADPSLVPTAILCRMAAKHLRVVLSGDGGDELFGGYPTYRAHRFAERWRYLLPAIAPLARAGLGMFPVSSRYQGLDWKIRKFSEGWDPDPLLRHRRWMGHLNREQSARLFGAHEEKTETAAGPDRLQAVMAEDFSRYMVGSVLAKVDRSSMAFGLEVRPPLLHKPLVDFAFSLPSEVKLAGGPKALLKEALGDILPASIRNRPKRGFAMPLAPLAHSLLRQRLEGILRDSPVWEVAGLDREAFRHELGLFWARKSDAAKAAWALIVLDHWSRRRL